MSEASPALKDEACGERVGQTLGVTRQNRGFTPDNYYKGKDWMRLRVGFFKNRTDLDKEGKLL